jgi:hypothetical protein
LRRVFRESSAGPTEGIVGARGSRDESQKLSDMQYEFDVDDHPSLVLSSIGSGIGRLCASVCNGLQIAARELKWERVLLSIRFADDLLNF